MLNTIDNAAAELHDKIVKCNGTEKSIAAISVDILHGKYMYSREDHKWYIFDDNEWKYDVTVLVTMRHDLTKIVGDYFDAMAKRYFSLAIREHANKDPAKVAKRYHNIVERMDKIKHKLGVKTFNDRVIREMRHGMAQSTLHKTLSVEAN